MRTAFGWFRRRARIEEPISHASVAVKWGSSIDACAWIIASTCLALDSR